MMLFRVECLALVAMAQYDYGNLASFSDRIYDYADGEYASLGRSNGSGDDAGLGFGAFYDGSYIATGDDAYLDPIFNFSSDDASFDDMMEPIQTTTSTTTSTTTKEQTTERQSTVDQRLRIDRRRPGLQINSTEEESTDSDLEELAVSNFNEDYASMLEAEVMPKRPLNAANNAAGYARTSGAFDSCLKCEGQSASACRTLNNVEPCTGSDNVCLVQIRTRFNGDDHQIYSRCVPYNTCINHEAQNFVGTDKRFHQCRTDLATKFVRNSVCNMCHKLGNSQTGKQIMFQSAGNIETGNGASPTFVSLTDLMNSPRIYLDPNQSGTYIYGKQVWY